MILKSTAAILQGMGSAGARGGKIATVTAPTTANTMTITFNQPMNTGDIRVQLKGFTTGGGFVNLSVRGTDGTNFWDVCYVNPPVAGAAGDYISQLLSFITDTPLTAITIILNLTAAATGGTPQLDAECWGALM